MLSCFLILSFYFVDNILIGRKRYISEYALYLLCCAVVIMTHGIGFLAIGFIFLYGLLVLCLEGRFSEIIRYSIVHVPLGLLALYPLAIGSLRGTVGLESFDLSLVGINLTIVLLGFNVPVPVFAGVLASFVLVVPCLFVPRARIVVATLFVLPLIVFLAVSITVKPIFNYRTIGIFTPFLMIGIAIWLSEAVRPNVLATPLRLLAVVPIPLMLVLSVNHMLNYEKENYPEIVAVWEAEAAADDVVFIDSATVDFWGFIHYVAGAELKSGLDVQPPPSPKWQRVHDVLGEDWAARLKLTGADPYLERRGNRIYPNRPGAEHAGLDRFWTFRRKDKPESLCFLPGYSAIEKHEIQHFELALCARGQRDS